MIKNPVSSYKDWFGKQSMRTKLALTFSTVVVAVFMAAMILLAIVIGNSYREKLLYSAEQSCDQAKSFLDNYLNTMFYVSELIYYNGDLQEILSSDDFHGDRTISEQYREFLVLNNILMSTEMVESIHRIKLYIPDELVYSENQIHFAPASELQNRADYQNMLEVCLQEKVYFTGPEITKEPPKYADEEIVSLFRLIRKTDGSEQVLGTEQVSVYTHKLKEILEKTDITNMGAVYLVNSDSQVVSVSGDEEAVLSGEKLAGISFAPKNQKDWEKQVVAGTRYLVGQRSLELSDWRLVALIPEKEIALQLIQLESIIIILTLVSIGLVILISYLVAKYYTDRLTKLSDMMLSVEQGNLEPGFGEQSPDEIGALFKRFSYMTQELKKLMDAQYRSGKAVKSAQFKALQAQINPHFLYNTLDLINWEAMDHDVPRLSEIAKSLARFYRISLNKGKEITTIEEELEHVKAYIKIQNYHFDGAIDLQITVPEALYPYACINSILQPLAENAIMHGLAEDIAVQHCTIQITGEQTGENITLTVEDDGLGMTQEQIDNLFIQQGSASNGYGVKNINSRIQLKYGDKYGLYYSSTIGEGTSVRVCLPALLADRTEELD